MESETRRRNERSSYDIGGLVTWQGHRFLPGIVAVIVLGLVVLLYFGGIIYPTSPTPFPPQIPIPKWSSAFMWLLVGYAGAIWAAGVLYVAARRLKDRRRMSFALDFAAAVLVAEVIGTIALFLKP